MNINGEFHSSHISPRLLGQMESLPKAPELRKTCQQQFQSGLLLHLWPPLFLPLGGPCTNTVHLDWLSHQILAFASFSSIAAWTSLYASYSTGVHTFRYPVHLARLRWVFFIFPYSANLSWMSSSVASSWTPVTKRIQLSTEHCGTGSSPCCSTLA